MDSLIHYAGADIARVLAALAPRTAHSIAVHLRAAHAGADVMHAVGRLFPRGDRAPAIEPISQAALESARAGDAVRLAGWRSRASQRIASGFYISQALEVRRR